MFTSEECLRTTCEKATASPVESSTKSSSQFVRQTEVFGGTNLITPVPVLGMHIPPLRKFSGNTETETFEEWHEQLI